MIRHGDAAVQKTKPTRKVLQAIQDKAVQQLSSKLAETNRTTVRSKLHELAARPGSTFMLVHVDGAGLLFTRFHHRPISIVSYIKPTKADRVAITTWFRGSPVVGDVLRDCDKHWMIICVGTESGLVEQVARIRPEPVSRLIHVKRSRKG